MFARIVGCAFNSYNYWHEGFDELCYEAGLFIELETAGFIPHRHVKRRVDLVVSDKCLGDVILELKAINFVGDEQRKQLWSYMKLTGMRYGMLINFGPKGVSSENWMLDELSGKCKRV